MQRLDTKLAGMDDKLGKGQDTAGEQAELVTMKNEVNQLDHAVMANFQAIEDHIVSHQLPDVILQLHKDAVAKYQRELNTLRGNLDAIDKAATNEDRRLMVQSTKAHLKSVQHQRTQQPFDPKHLPFSVPDGKVRAPFEKKADFQGLLFEPKPVQVAAVTLPPGLLATDGTTPLPQTEDTQATEDVQITADIQALAASLNNDPVKIYNWVHNNIEFLPTYGSIQGSQMTLDSKKGNAFDTASLLIALLRAAQIPARYAYGTVQLPINKVMNWVGGVTVPEAALQVLAQGGIPNTGLAQGGVIKYVKMEHVWVEAWVDYQPSRGAKNIQGDSWVPMDASFKQYTYTQGTDLQTAVPFDAQALVDQITQGAQINNTEGWVSGVNESLVQTALTNYQTQVQDYLTANNPTATVSDILGTKTITPRNAPTLALGLPYQLLIQASSLAALPTSIRHQFRFKLYATKLDQTLDSPLFSFTDSLPTLAGKKITLAFSPASQADRDLIDSYLPVPAADGTIDPANWPTSLPGYLINLIPEVRVDGTVVASGGIFTAGEEFFTSTEVKHPGEAWEGAGNTQVAGEMIAISINGAGTAGKQLSNLQARIQQTQAQLATGTGEISREAFLGDTLYGTALSYFGMLDGVESILSAGMSNVLTYRLPSFGSYTTALKVNYAFGIPRSVQSGGLVMDIDRSHNAIIAKNNDHARVVQFAQAMGMVSSLLEHVVPEQIYSDPANPTQGVSAVKLISLANQQGQKIYTIDQSNVSTTLPLLTISQDVKTEISSAVNAGQIVTTHQADITVDGWTGAGYIISDPLTGSGAYKISGGANGGGIVATAVNVVLTLKQTITTLFGGEAAKGFSKLLGPLNTVFQFIMSADDLLKKCTLAEAIALLVILAALTALVLSVEALLLSGVGAMFVLGMNVALDALVQTVMGRARDEVCSQP